MVPMNQLDADTILSEEILLEVFEEKDEIYKARLLLSLTDRAKELGVKAKFESLVKAYKKVERSIQKENNSKNTPQKSFDNYTQFTGNYDQYYCGNWIADDTGIRTFTLLGEQLACYHPIIPVQRLVNAETGKEKIKIAFRKGASWKDIIVDKEVIASSNKIVSLSGYGISVTSESAKALVRFLADIENFNIDLIETQVSTSKLGWINGEFMPYTQNTIFDNEIKFKDVFESIVEQGDFDTWINLIKKIRKADRIEPQIYMAGSFGSILLEPLDILSFVLNIWGDSGKGKTVSMMLATSIWANPKEGAFATDPTDSLVSLEVRNDVINNMPMILDDLSKRADKFGMDEVTDLVYMLCSGKGKGRSNVNLGLRKTATWKNITLTNIERPLATETMRGGAINRIIDIEMDDGDVFEDGNAIVAVINRNYGFAGKLFVEAVLSIGMEEIKSIQQGFLEDINECAARKNVEKESKQTLPLSVLLTADKIATDHIFKDNIYLDIEKCVDYLKNKGEVSEHERAYDYIMGEVSVNINKFKPDHSGEYRGEVWGSIENGYAIILNNAFNNICQKGNFSNKAFLNWAKKQDLIVTQGGKNTKTKRISGSVSRCVWLKIKDDSIDEDGFMQVEDDQMELPFG